MFELEVHAYFVRGGRFSVQWNSQPRSTRNVRLLPAYILQLGPRKLIQELTQLADHRAQSTLEDIASFYWLSDSPSFSFLDAVVYNNKTAFMIYTIITWEHSLIATAGSRTSWKSLALALGGLLALGTRMALVHIADNDESGRKLCMKHKGESCAVGCSFIERDTFAQSSSDTMLVTISALPL